MSKILFTLQKIAISINLTQRVLGGTQIIIWWGVCGPRSETLNPYLRISAPKMADLTIFFLIFANLNPFLWSFLPKKQLILQFVLVILVIWDPLLRFCLTKMGPFSKEFWWKTNPFGQHIPVCLNLRVPSPTLKGCTAICNKWLLLFDWKQIVWENMRLIINETDIVQKYTAIIATGWFPEFLNLTTNYQLGKL